jgi:glycosyltransferase involved in cell wall biosynthesis
MNILYHLTILPPKRPQCEALSQEVAALRAQFESDLVYLNPNVHMPIYIPRLLFGFQKLRRLRAREAAFDLHHLYNPDPFPFPILRFLRRPVLYTISSGLGPRRPNIPYFNHMAGVVVYDQRSATQLREWGVHNVHRARPGIDITRFTHNPQPLTHEVRLLVGSAPWTLTQFRTKGVDALLQAAKREPRLKLTFLWRGVHFEAMHQRVRDLGIASQVQVINHRVNVNAMLAEMHAAVALAGTSTLIKAYPHSLLESLAAGKPVLVSQAIPMADYVQETGCGYVVDNVTVESILKAVDELLLTYQEVQDIAKNLNKLVFSQNNMILSFINIYQHILN